MALFKSLKSIFKKPTKAKKPKKKPISKPTEVSPAKIAKVVKPVARKRDLSGVYRILKEPHISEKATILADKNKYIFKVYPKANKVETKKAVENLYGVRVKDVNIINVHRKKRIMRGIEGFKTGYKKAIVTLEEGNKIEILPH